MKKFPLRHVVLRSLLGSLLLACSVHAATTPAELETLRAKAKTGNAIAQYNLGLACADLHESFYDPVESYVWLNLAASNGTTGKALAAITDTMTPAQLAEGKRRFAALRAAAVPSSPVAATQASPASAPGDAPAAASKESAQPASSLNAQLADANKRLAIAQAALVSKDKTIASLQGQLATIPAPAPATDTTVLSSLSAKLTQTTDALVAARRAQSLSEAEAASLKANADKVSAERLAIAAQLENTTVETARLRTELDALKSSAPAESSAASPLSATGITVLKADRDRLTETVAKITEERDALVRQLADLKAASPAAADQADVRDRLAAAEKARAETQSNLDAALRTYTLNQAEIERLQRSLAIIEGERADAVAKLETANKELVTLRPQAETAAASATQVVALRAQLAEAQRTAADRADTIDRSAQDLATARQTAAGAANELAVVREQLRLTQAQSASCANEVLELKTRLALGGGVPTAPSRPGSNSLFPSSVAVTSPVVSLPVATPATGPAAKPEVAPPSDVRTHVVASGDSLSSIAKRYYGNANRWNDILEANRGTLRNADTLTLGTKLRIP